MIGKSLLLLASLFAVASSQTSGGACSENTDCKSCNEKKTGCKWFVPNRKSKWPEPICRPKRACRKDHKKGFGTCIIGKIKKCPRVCTYYGVHQDDGCAKGDFCKIGVGKCKAKIASQGVCHTPSPYCTKEWDPVCGCDGVTYGNECSARGAGVNVRNVGCCSNDKHCKTIPST